MLGHDAPRLPPGWQVRYSTDVLNLVIPTRTALLAPPGATSFADRFGAGLAESGAYLGPLVLVAMLAAGSLRRSRSARLVTAILVLAVLASLGSVVHVGGTPEVTLPWSPLTRLPLIRFALPARFMVYAWLVLAVLTALWLAAPVRRPWRRIGRWALVSLCVAALLPNLTLPLWRAHADTPAFFSAGLYRHYLMPGGNTLVIPFGSNGSSMLWQAETGLAFPMAGGYTTCEIPPQYRRWATVASFLAKRRIMGYRDQLQAFLGRLNVPNIVVDPRADGPWRKVFGILPVRPVAVGGVLLYRLPETLLERHRQKDPPNTQKRALERSCQ